MTDNKTPKRRVSIAGVLLRLVFAGVLWAIVWGAINPNRAIPPGWNPLAPLRVDEPVTLFTNWRLERALDTDEACITALTTASQFTVMDDLTPSAQCHILNRVDLVHVGQARLKNVETTCAIALRMAMWERHSLQPAAKTLGTTVTGIDHIGSYNCREIRTASGATGRLSTHATASAVDIAGFQFANGENARVLRDWGANDAKSAFLQQAKQGACKWFQLTLSPDYNALHADHFHLQSRGWGGCR